MIEVADSDAQTIDDAVARRPRLAVLIPVFNDQPGLERALGSLAAEEGERFIVYVVDDGSDPPISIPDNLPYVTRLVRQEPNQGITAALNMGLLRIAAAGYEYVARLDAGDLSLPGRFTAQLAFLDHHPKHAAVGTATRHVDAAGQFLFNFRPPIKHNDVMRGLRYRAMLVHPSIMMRVKAVQNSGMYKDLFPCGEDYDLFFRMGKEYELANLEQIFLIKEINEYSITSNRRKLLLERIRLLKWYFDPRSIHSYLGIVISGFLLLVPRSIFLRLRYWWHWLRAIPRG